MITFLVIIGVIFIIGGIVSANNSQKKPNRYIKPPVNNYQITDQDLINTASKPVKKPVKKQFTKSQTVKHFSDGGQSFDDYSHLSPSEARREMKERKEYGEWLEFDEYGGYMNVIYEGKDDYYI